MTLHRCIVEVDDRAVGLLTLENDEYVFHAVVPEAQELEGTVYPDPEAALVVVRQSVSRRQESPGHRSVGVT